MNDIAALLSATRRPRLLVRAARFGVIDYCRDRDLRRILRDGPIPGPEKALPRLFEEEERMEDTRRAGDASYSVARHVELLIALMAEARLLPAPQAQAA